MKKKSLKSKLLTWLCLFITLSSQVSAQVAANITVGPGGNYTSFTNSGGLFSAINSVGMNQNVTVTVIGDILETGAFNLNEFAAPHTLTIRPNSATLRTIQMTAVDTLFVFNGTDRVTIDGSFNGSGRFLRFVNNNATAANTKAVFSIYNGATNLQFLNCIFESNGSADKSSIFYFGTSSATTPNSNITIRDNIFRASTASNPGPYAQALYADAWGSIAPRYIHIVKNDFVKFKQITSNFSALVQIGRMDTSRIDSNNFYDINTTNDNVNDFTLVGSLFSNTGALSRGLTINYNSFGGSNADRSGTGMLIGGGAGFSCIGVRFDSLGLNEIKGNRFGNIGTKSAPIPTIAVHAIQIFGGTVNVFDNVVGGRGNLWDTLVTGYDNGWIQVTTTNNTLSSDVINIYNNTISHARYYRGENDRHCGIHINSMVGQNKQVNVYNNNINNLFSNGTVNNNAFAMFGIRIGVVSSNSSINVYGNNITLLTTNKTNNTTTNTGAIVAGIVIVGGVPTTSIKVYNNTISKLNVVSVNPRDTGVNVPVVAGILLSNGLSNPLIYNNQISLNSTLNTRSIFSGIYSTASSPPTNYPRIFNNSIYITGTATSFLPSEVSACITKTGTSAMQVFNNILYNNRTGSPPSFTLDIRNNSNIGDSSFQNNLYVNPTTDIAKWPVIGAQTLTSWRALRNFDTTSTAFTTSQLPVANFFPGANAANLTIAPASQNNVVGKGISLAQVTTDFNGNPRPSPPSVGAFEYGSIGPNISVSGTLTAFTSCAGTASAQQSFTVGGSNLTANIIITPPSGFEVSTTSGSGFSSSVTLTQNSGAVASTTIYVRITNSATGTPSGNITCASTGATTQNVSASGTVNAKPTINIDSVEPLLTTATSFGIPYSGTTGSPNQYSIVSSLPNAMPGFTAVNNATLNAGIIAVTIPQSTANTYNFKLVVTNSNTGCVSDTIPFTVNVVPPQPTITTSGNLTSFVSCEGLPSAQQSFTVSGAFLTNNISLTAPSGFEISTTSGAGFTSSLILSHSDGTVNTTTIYIRLSGIQGVLNGAVSCTSAGATTKNVSVSGIVNEVPAIVLLPVPLVISGDTLFTLSYTTASGGPDEYSITTGLPNAMPNFIPVSSTIFDLPKNIVMPASAPGSYNFNLNLKSNVTGCISSTYPFSVTVGNPLPVVNISGSFDPISACSGSPSGSQQFKVSGTFLTGNITITAPVGFEVATTLTGTYGTTINLTPVAGTIIDTPLYVRMSSTATGTPSGNITCTSTGATTQSISITGTVTPLPAAPVISIQPASPICAGTEYLNFGASTTPPTGVTYNWSTSTNANLYAQGSTRQYSLISFPNAGSVNVILTATQNGCSASTTLPLTIQGDTAHKATVRYFNNNFVCNANFVNLYQWGYDDKPTLKGNVINGEITQNYFNASPDFANKAYWVISTKGSCYQKSYFNIPTGAQPEILTNDVLQVYPNPFNSTITVGSNKGIQGATLELLDLHGKTLKTFSAHAESITLDLTELASGVYFIKLTKQPGQVNTSKIIKY